MTIPRSFTAAEAASHSTIALFARITIVTMPMYEYTCRKCNHAFEKLVKSMSSTDPIHCPKCASRQTDRKISVFAVASEGSGKSAGEMPMCGRCNGPGGCGMN